ARLLQDEALCDWVEKAIAEVAYGRLRAQLTVSGEYAKLSGRARSKQQNLEQLGVSNPKLSATSMTEDELIRWYFENCDRITQPPNAVVALRAAGFTDVEEFRRVALREYLYRNFAEDGAQVVS